MPGGALPTQNVSLTEAVSASQASARRRSLSLTLQRAVKTSTSVYYLRFPVDRLPHVRTPRGAISASVTRDISSFLGQNLSLTRVRTHVKMWMSAVLGNINVTIPPPAIIPWVPTSAAAAQVGSQLPGSSMDQRTPYAKNQFSLPGRCCPQPTARLSRDSLLKSRICSETSIQS